VQHSISAFGGNPDNATLIGQSAGAGSVASQLTMPTGAGLFRRAVAQSLPGTFFTDRLAAAISAEIASDPEKRADPAALPQLSPLALVAATERLLP